MSLGIIIQARTGSTRLPNKMILPFYEGKGILETILMRLKNGKLDVPIVLATTTQPSDDILEEIGKRQNVFVFRGSSENVLDRFINATESHKFSKIIRICADNPFLDIEALKFQINSFEKSNVDYWCYSLSDQTPSIKTHYGFWTEGVKLETLKQIKSLTNSKLFLEHVTNYIYSTENKFQIHRELIPKEIEKEKRIRLTIDTEKDFVLAKEIYNNALLNNIELSANSLLNYIKPNIEWLESMNQEINKNIK